ncbi:MAG: twin-arginine translocase TatA/TatE family subunit [Acidobacteria bacterium]|nr:twin-arginine translocase TatA/TatE family subunit [Acidobacteriota bacterium]
MGDLFQPWHLIILAGLAILLFGGKKLPELGKGLGEGLRGFKEGMKGINDDVKGDAKADAKAGDTAHVVTPKPDEAVKPPAA